MRIDRIAYGLAVLACAIPLWVTGRLPFVDLPQHLHVISVLSRLDDPSTLYPQMFEARATLTPYLGHYAVVGVLSRLVPIAVANKVFLTAYVAAMPLSVAFLLTSLGRPSWPSLLALPFAYGDSLGWGFINYCSSLPLTFAACGLVVRALTDAQRRARWTALLGVTLIALLCFHVLAFVFVVLSLPLLLFTTRIPRDGRRARAFALAGAIPALALFGIWTGMRLAHKTPIHYGAPWQAWGPIFSSQNLVFKPFAQNLRELPVVLANMLRDGSDRYGLYIACVCASLALVREWRANEQKEFGIERFRILALAGLALALFFLVPFDVRGYGYYLNTRYAHLAAPLVLASVPVVTPRVARGLTVGAAVAAAISGLALARGFRDFDRESSAIDTLVAATGPTPMIATMIADPGSRVVNHGVYAHTSCDLAREHGGATSFSFAETPHSPLKYRSTPPPEVVTESAHDQLDFRVYDHFLVRGRDPLALFGARLGTELYVAAQAEGFTLVRRR